MGLASNMKRIFILAIPLSLIGLALGACSESGFAPPPVTKELGQTHSQERIAQLEEGRHFYVSRCIECHTLPVAARFTESEWPSIVDEMGRRAGLKSKEREAVLAYILAIRRLK